MAVEGYIEFATQWEREAWYVKLGPFGGPANIREHCGHLPSGRHCFRLPHPGSQHAGLHNYPSPREPGRVSYIWFEPRR